MGRDSRYIYIQHSRIKFMYSRSINYIFMPLILIGCFLSYINEEIFSSYLALTTLIKIGSFLLFSSFFILFFSTKFLYVKSCCFHHHHHNIFCYFNFLHIFLKHYERVYISITHTHNIYRESKNIVWARGVSCFFFC